MGGSGQSGLLPNRFTPLCDFNVLCLCLNCDDEAIEKPVKKTNHINKHNSSN